MSQENLIEKEELHSNSPGLHTCIYSSEDLLKEIMDLLSENYWNCHEGGLWFKIYNKESEFKPRMLQYPSRFNMRVT